MFGRIMLLGGAAVLWWDVASAFDLEAVLKGAAKDVLEQVVQGGQTSISMDSLLTPYVGDDGVDVNGPGIYMYETQRCTYCVQARRYFAQRGITYVSRDIQRNRTAQAEFRELRGVGTPLVFVDGQRMSGWSAPDFENMLRRRTRR